MLARAESTEEIERVNSRSVPVTPRKTQGVAADGRDCNDPHLSPAHHGTRKHLESPLGLLGLSGRATVCTGTRRPQIVEGILAVVAIPPADDETVLRLFKMVIYWVRFEPHTPHPRAAEDGLERSTKSRHGQD